MAIPRTGQLGAAAPGALWLGALPVWSRGAPVTTGARSALSEPGAPRSSISAAGVRSTISAATATGRIG